MGNHHSSGHKNWRELLAATTVSQLISARLPPIGKIIKVSSTADLKTALNILAEANILAAPVYSAALDADVGIVDVLDIAELIAETSPAEAGAWQLGWQVKPEVFTATVSQVMNRSKANKVVDVKAETTLLEVLKKMTEQKLHRLAVVNEKSQVVDILTQSDVIAFIVLHSYDPWFSDRADMSLEALGHAHKTKLIVASEKDITLAALALLPQERISAMPVVDAHGQLVGSLSSAMLRGLRPENAGDLSLPIGEFLKKRAIKSQAFCQPSTTFRDAVRSLATNHIHRIFVVDAQTKPTGVLTLSDVISVLESTANKDHKH